MENAFNIPDPSDWLQTPLAGLSRVENPLHCQVCKDFLNTPMITSCSHTFCSLCIRKCLTEDGKCPTCRAEDQQVRLRRNWMVEELVDAFVQVRPSTLALARTFEQESTDEPPRKKRRQSGEMYLSGSPEVGSDDGLSTTRPPARRRSSRQSGKKPPGTVIDLLTDEGMDKFENDLSACPICGLRMKEEAVFAHLDVHSESGPPEAKGMPASRQTNPYFRKTNSQASPVLEPLPQINYSLLKDQPLRKKLSELGIKSDGPRQLLISRHKEWVNLVNANCDSQKPRSKRDLLRELDTWDTTQGRHLLSNGTNGPGSIAHKDFDGKAWASNHHVDFNRLIAAARSKAKTKARKDQAENEGSGEHEQHSAEGGAEHQPGASDLAVMTDRKVSEGLHEGHS